MESIKYQSFDRHQPDIIRSGPGSVFSVGLIWVSTRSKQRRGSRIKSNSMYFPVSWYNGSGAPVHQCTSSGQHESGVSGLSIVMLSLSRRARYLDRLNCSFVNSKQIYNNTPNKTIKPQQFRQRPERKYLCYPI